MGYTQRCKTELVSIRNSRMVRCTYR